MDTSAHALLSRRSSSLGSLRPKSTDMAASSGSAPSDVPLPVAHVAIKSPSSDLYTWYPCLPSQHHDMFQIARQSSQQSSPRPPTSSALPTKPKAIASPRHYVYNDFVVPGRSAVRRGTTDVMISKMAVYDFRIICNRSDAADVRIYAGRFDHKGRMVCGTKALRWKLDSGGTPRDGSGGADAAFDAFPNGSGVLLWRPVLGLDGVAVGGKWMEVSVLGHVHELRSVPNCPGALVDPAVFAVNGDVDSVGPLNRLVDGCIVYTAGMAFMWRRSASDAEDGTGTMEGQAARILDSVRGTLSDGLTCPVTLDSIPCDRIAESIKERSFFRNMVVLTRIKWVDDLRIKMRAWGNSDDAAAEAVISGRPWFFSSCGHVFSLYDTRLRNATRSTTPCSVCRAAGLLIPLSVRPSPDIIPATPSSQLPHLDHAFVPCGHMIDAQGARFWSAGIAFPPQPDDPRAADASPVVQPDESWAPICPFCAVRITAVRKLFFQHV
ncbi:hypothetical protein BC831DRAFT_517570 [Entophlyctis helioformis]|nr:hypothetical protein BC831DRAFT_517570 [Entophlyctis helioformis]